MLSSLGACVGVGETLTLALLQGPEVEAPRVVSARRKDISRGLAKVPKDTMTSVVRL